MRPSPQLALFASILMTVLVTNASAHEIRPALLSITGHADGRYDVAWKRPVMGDMAVHLVPHLSGGLIDRAPDVSDRTPSFQLSLWRNVDFGAKGLEGRTISIEGLDKTITDVLVSITFANGDTLQPVLTPSHPEMMLGPGASGVAVPAYLVLGIEHILTGYDHLAFVLGLVLLVACRAMLLWTITAFTLAHSLTLGATALHLITVRAEMIEALVALSILFVAVELIHVRRGHRPMMARFPWAVALGFGLLHGSAFAGALAEIGLPQDAVLSALFLFNVGIEVGQLLFIGALLTVGWAIARASRPAERAWPQWVPPYAIGTLAAFWFIDRIAIALS